MDSIFISACIYGDLEIVKYIVEKGANIHIHDTRKDISTRFENI